MNSLSFIQQTLFIIEFANKMNTHKGSIHEIKTIDNYFLYLICLINDPILVDQELHIL